MNDQRLYQVLLAPHVSEKTATASELEGRHTFRVANDATKIEVRKAVEKLRALSPLWDMYKDGIDLNSIEWAAH